MKVRESLTTDRKSRNSNISTSKGKKQSIVNPCREAKNSDERKEQCKGGGRSLVSTVQSSKSVKLIETTWEIVKRD